MESLTLHNTFRKSDLMLLALYEIKLRVGLIVYLLHIIQSMYIQ